MPRALRAVEPNEVPPPQTMAEAAGRSRREFLARSRAEIATVIDAGVPAHALARLISEADRIDSEIRRLDTADAQEAGREAVSDEPFNAAAI